MNATILFVLLALLGGVVLLCRYTSASSPLALRWLRAKLWFISVGRWSHWKVMAGWTGARWGRFRQHVPRKPDFRRWGGYVLGIEIGDRGGTRAGLRHRLRLDPCPHAPHVTSALGCGTCGAEKPVLRGSEQRQAAMSANFGRPPKVPPEARPLAFGAAHGLGPASLVQAHHDGRLVAVGRGWEPEPVDDTSHYKALLSPAELADYDELEAAYAERRDVKPICKMRINGGNGNPANAHRECPCQRPGDCKLGGRGVAPAGPEQDVITERFERA